jgi:two-component system response regulator
MIERSTGRLPALGEQPGGDRRSQILVVEDNADDSFLLTRQLARAHFEDCVTVIGNGQDALDFLQHSSAPPLAIFLDLRLPGLSGIEVLEQIRANERIRAVPVIIMTGSVDPKDVEECSRLGVTAYLPKPVGLSTFIKTVAHLFPKISVEQN